MEIVFIRHFRTPGNLCSEYIGSTDEPLLSEAEDPDRAGRFVYPAVQAVIASHMMRCIQTAEILYPGQKISTDERLRECDFGLFEGKTFEELKNEPAYMRWLNSGGKTAFPGGEEQEAFRSRCVSGVKDRVRRLMEAEVKRAAFVVHGGTIMAVLEQMADAEDNSFYRWHVENGGGFSACVSEQEWLAGDCRLQNIFPLEIR